MMNKKNLKYSLFLVFAAIFCSAGLILAFLDVHTTLGILPPPYAVTYAPAHITGMYTSGTVYVEITGDGIKPNST